MVIDGLVRKRLNMDLVDMKIDAISGLSEEERLKYRIDICPEVWSRSKRVAKRGLVFMTERLEDDPRRTVSTQVVRAVYPLSIIQGQTFFEENFEEGLPNFIQKCFSPKPLYRSVDGEVKIYSPGSWETKLKEIYNSLFPEKIEVAIKNSS